MADEDAKQTVEEKPDTALQAPPDAATITAALEAMSRGVAFGPAFFAHELGALIRDRCPDPTVALPRVLLHVAGGDVLQVVNIIAVTPRWVALAVHHEDLARTEIVQYAIIGRVTIEAVPPNDQGRRIGFRQEKTPEIVSQ
jgi:hypothetical protein